LKQGVIIIFSYLKAGVFKRFKPV